MLNSKFAQQVAKLEAKEPVTQDEVTAVEQYLATKVSAEDIACFNEHLRKSHRAQILARTEDLEFVGVVETARAASSLERLDDCFQLVRSGRIEL